MSIFNCLPLNFSEHLLVYDTLGLLLSLLYRYTRASAKPALFIQHFKNARGLLTHLPGERNENAGTENPETPFLRSSRTREKLT